MSRRPILLVLLASTALGFGVVTPAPAMADPVDPLTFTYDKTEAHPGDTVTIDVTFTNPETVDVTFSYLSIYSTWPTLISDVKYGFTSCTGQISSCWMLYASFDRGAAMHHEVVIPPQATRTVELVYRVAPDSPCGDGRHVGLTFYTYRESTAGAFDEVVPGPHTDVVC